MSVYKQNPFFFNSCCIKPAVQWVQGVLSQGINEPRSEAYHSSPSSVQIMNVWSHTLVLICLSGAQRDSFTFTVTYCRHQMFNPCGKQLCHYGVTVVFAV